MKVVILIVSSLVCCITVIPRSALQAAEPTNPLIVVEDLGSASALPYYEALNLLPRTGSIQHPPLPIPEAPPTISSEAQMLPVRSSKLTPGKIIRRGIEAPGLQPFFLVGDDEASHGWLRQHAASLLERQATGLVVNVETMAGLTQLRALASDLQFWPVSGDDLADRLGLRHYPVLITATGIEQ